jgi:predicted O-linked N-acetylglucosamine transferase (SPINDLY family)
MTSPETLMHEAAQLQRDGRFAEAAERYSRYTQLRPNDATGWHNLAAAAHAGGNLALAARAIARALDLRPSSAHWLLLAGNIRQDLGDLEGASRQLEKAVRLDPGFASAHNNLGIVLRARGLKAQAEAAFRAAVQVRPDYARAWNNLGTTLLHLERGAEAVECFRRAVALEPGYAHAHLNLGMFEVSMGRYAEAESALRRAIELAPSMVEAQLGLGRLYREMLDLDRAEVAFRQAVNLDPRNVDAWLLLAEVLAERGLHAAGRDCYARALDVQPKNLRARMGLALTLPQIYADAADVERSRAHYEAGLAALERELPGLAAALNAEERASLVQWNNFYLAYQGGDDRGLQESFARLQRAVLEPSLPELYAPIARSPRAGRRLRVGFVSQFFYHCTAGNYFKSWVTKLDPARFEPVVFSLNNRPDAVTQEVECAAAKFVQGAFSFEGLARAVRAERLDALIYPELGMSPRVFTLASLRLAPLQCAGWGHPVTTGHANLDVMFSSEAMEPPGAQSHYSERLVTLPGLGTHYSRPSVPDPVSRAELGLPEDAFLCLFPQSVFKIHPDNDRLLVEILARNPRTVLVMFQGRFEPLTRQFVNRLQRRFAERGLATAGRVRLLPAVGHQDYLRINLACDVMLDSLHWSGGNTSLDAIACGLPIVTHPGAFMRGRQSAGMLSIMGVDALVAPSREAYVELATRLGMEPALRARMSAAIAEGSSRLFDQEAPVRALEDFLLSAFRE